MAPTHVSTRIRSTFKPPVIFFTHPESKYHRQTSKDGINILTRSNLDRWYYSIIQAGAGKAASSNVASGSEFLETLDGEGYKLLADLLEYDPERRLTAEKALEYPLFHPLSKVGMNCFDGLEVEYPHRRVSQDDTDIRTGSRPVTKRSDLPDDTRRAKKSKEV
jgi:cyclin-dependent kinase 8/11